MPAIGQTTAPPIRLLRFTWVLILAWTVMAGALLAWNIVYERHRNRHLAEATARAHFNKDQAFRRWATSHGGVYVPANERTPPNDYLADIPERDITTPSGVALTLMNPAYMVRQMNEDFAEYYGVAGRITSLKPLRPENAPDDWERAALERFERGEEEVQEWTEISGEPYLRLMRPMITLEPCLKCHAHQGYKVGDVRGGVAVSLPLSEISGEEASHIASEAISHGLLWLLGCGGILFGSGRIRSRIRDRERAEGALRESNERYRVLVENAPEAIVVLDVGAGRFVDANENAARLFKMSREALLEGNPASRSPPTQPDGRPSAESAAEKIANAVAGEKPTFEWTHRDNEGNDIPCEVRLVRLPSSTRRLIRGSLTDITERKRHDGQMAAVNRLIERLLGPGDLATKLHCITDGIVETFDADFARIWIAKLSDRCGDGCPHAEAMEGHGACGRGVEPCLHLVASSGRYTHLDGKLYSRVPIGRYKIGRVAAGDQPKFLINDVGRDGVVHDREWARELGLVAFAGYKLSDADGQPMGVLALFSKREIQPEEDALLEGLSKAAAQVVQTAQAEEARQRHVRFLENTDRIDRIIRQGSDFEAVLQEAIGAVLDLFQADRAWLLYPCDPEAESWSVPIECTRPEYPGASATGQVISMTPEVAEMVHDALGSDDPIVYGPGHGRPVPQASEPFAVQSQMHMAIHPRLGKPWIMGVHQCSHARIWTAEEKALFVGVAHRISDALSDLLFNRDLRESEEKLRNIIEHSTNVFYTHTPDHVLTYMSPQSRDVFDCEPEACLHEWMNFVTDNPDNRIGFERTQRAIDTGLRQDAYELELVGKKGRRVWVEVHEAPIVQNGRTVAIVGALTDITERKRAQQAAGDAQRRLLEQQRTETQRVQAELDKVREQLVAQTRLATIGQITGSISHELLNPLGAARNAAYYLRRYSTRLKPEMLEYLEIIDQEIGTADRIISDMTDMTRAKQIRKQTIDLRGVVTNAFLRIQPPAEIHCDIRLQPDPFAVEADANQLAQVFLNLASNAVQAMDGRGSLTIQAQRNEAWDIITVRDTGPGVKPEHRDRLFEALFTTKAKGTGLGLTICRDVVERHGGSIDLIDEDRPGAAFRVRLPRGGTTEPE